MKCNKRFIKVDSPKLKLISELSASFIHYSLSVNFFSEILFSKKDIPGRTLFIIYQRNNIYDAEYMYLVFDDRCYITIRRRCHLARLTIADKMADHSCSNKRSMERVGKVMNADNAKKCNTTCDLIPLSEINTKHHKRIHSSPGYYSLINSLITRKPTHFIHKRSVSISLRWSNHAVL